MNQMGPSQPIFNNSMPDIPESQYPRCEHNSLTTVAITKKNGPNFGRPFYRCAMDYPDGCNFFQWVHPTEEEIGKTERFRKRKAEEKSANLSQQAFQSYMQQQLELLMNRQNEMMSFIKKIDDNNGTLNKKIHELGGLLVETQNYIKEAIIEEEEDEQPKKKKTNVSYNY